MRPIAERFFLPFQRNGWRIELGDLHGPREHRRHQVLGQEGREPHPPH